MHQLQSELLSRQSAYICMCCMGTFAPLHNERGTSHHRCLIRMMGENSSFGQSEAASIQTDVATSSFYSPVTADTVHTQSPQEFIFKPALQACCHGYRVQAISTSNILHLMHLAVPQVLSQWQASQKPRADQFPSAFCSCCLLADRS